MRRAVVLAVVVAACALAGTARADGDPASDYLLGSQVFLPFDAKLPQAKQQELISLVAATNKAGYKIRVALIGSTYDLGAVTPLWLKPRQYARFLGVEIGFVYRQRLLIVMPNGFGFNWPKHSSTKEDALLAKIPVGKGGLGLLAAAEEGVRKLAAANGVKAEPAAAPSHASNHDRAVIILASIGLIAIAVLIRVGLRRKRA
jgi:hypothetical protein